MKKVASKKKEVIETKDDAKEDKEEPKSTKLDDIIEKKNKSCGPGTMFYGSKLRYNPPRLPTGVFSIDFISGGGAPLHGSTCFWGGETGAKTYLAIKAMLMTERICWKCFNQLSFCTCSQKSLEMKTSWIDIEGTLEGEWVEACGPDPSKYIVTLADCAEDGIDCADASLQADDCGLVVLDSLGHLLTEWEMDRGVGESNMGVQASVVTRTVKKLKLRMIRERKRGHPCAVIFINQMRKMLNEQFGAKEGQSGGHAMKHEFSLLFRCGKKIMKTDGADAKYYDEKRKRHLASRHTCAIYKEKVFIISRSAEFVLIKENIPVLELKKGSVDDISLVLKSAKEYSLLNEQKGKEKYKIERPKKIGFNTIKKIKTYFLKNQDVYFQFQKIIIDEASKRIKGK